MKPVFPCTDRSMNMKLKLLCLIVCIGMVLPGLAAAKEDVETSSYDGPHWRILGALGGADSGFNNVMVDLGIEFSFSKNLGLQLLANNHFSDQRRYYDYYYPYGGGFVGYNPNGVSVGLDFNTLHGFTLFGVHKFKLSKSIKWFSKAGINVTFYSQWDVTIDGVYTKNKKSGLGGAVGTGLEYQLADRVGLILGTTYKRLIREVSNLKPDDPDTNLDWFKFYIGLYYRFK